MIAWLRRWYHRWWIADDETSRWLDETEQRVRIKEGRQP